MDEILNLPASDSSVTLSISREQLLWSWETRQSALFDLESKPLAIALKNCIEIRYRLDVGIQAILDSICDTNQSIHDPWQTPELVKYLDYIELQKMQIPDASAAAEPHVSTERTEEALDREQAAKRFWTSYQSTITGPHNYEGQTHQNGSSPQRHQHQQQPTSEPRWSIPSTGGEWTWTEDQKIRDGIQAGLTAQDIYVIRFLGHVPTRTEVHVLRRYNLLKQTVRNNSPMVVPGNQTSQSSMTAQNTLNAGIPLQTFQSIPHSIQEVQQELVEAVTVLAEENAKPHAEAQVQQQTHLQASMQIMQNQQAAQRMQNSMQHIRPPQHLDQPFQDQIMPNHLQPFQKKTLQQLQQLQPFRARAHAQAQAQARSQASLQQEASQQQGINMMQSQQAALRMAPQTRAGQATQNVQASPQQNVQPSEFFEEIEIEGGASEDIRFVEGNNIYTQVLKFQRRNAQNP